MSEPGGERGQPSPELTYAALQVVEDMRSCLRRLANGWRADFVFTPEGRWTRYSIAEHAVVAEPMTNHERVAMSGWARWEGRWTLTGSAWRRSFRTMAGQVRVLQAAAVSGRKDGPDA